MKSYCPSGNCYCHLLFVVKWIVRMQHQTQEARGPKNRYYFGLKHGREAKDDRELLAYYIENGGAKNFETKEPLIVD
jgi:hypothetical protein